MRTLRQNTVIMVAIINKAVVTEENYSHNVLCTFLDDFASLPTH